MIRVRNSIEIMELIGRDEKMSKEGGQELIKWPLKRKPFKIDLTFDTNQLIDNA